MPEPISLVIVDDHPIFRSGLVQVLGLDPMLQVVAEGETASEAIALSRQHRPDILLLDLGMLDNGLSAITTVMEASPATKVVVVTASDAAADVSAALEHGAAAYILKGTRGGELIATLARIQNGESYISPRALNNAIAASRRPATEGPVDSLSRQERKVLDLLAQGLSNREIGQQLEVHEKTIKFHLSNIFTKLGVRNRVEAVLAAKQHLQK